MTVELEYDCFGVVFYAAVSRAWEATRGMSGILGVLAGHAPRQGGRRQEHH